MPAANFLPSASNGSSAISNFVAGTLKRLYVKSASAGSATAPAPGDPSISTRSAALGDPITAGTTRFYMVYYRDPFVIGGCAATATFNATQAQSVLWNP